MPVRAVGLDQVARSLRAAGEQVQDLTPENTDVATFIAARSTPGMRRQTGRMAASTRGEGTPTRARVIVDVVYAGPAIFGWRRRNIAPASTTPVSVAIATMPRWINTYAAGITDRILSKIKGA